MFIYVRGSGNQRILHFGLGENLIDHVTINWTSGYREIRTDLVLNAKNYVDYVTAITIYANGFD